MQVRDDINLETSRDIIIYPVNHFSKNTETLKATMAKLGLLLDTFFILFVLATWHSFPSLCCPEDQKQALLQFKDLLNSSTDTDFRIFSSWNSSSSCCHWPGVTCHSNSPTPQVTSLNLSYVIGSVNSNVLSPLFRLHSLKSLAISDNDIEGEVPGSGLANLTQLEDLDMSVNRYSGSIPPQLFCLRHLKSQHKF